MGRRKSWRAWQILALTAVVVVLVLGTFAPANADSRYAVRVGDQLKIEVLEDQSLNRFVLVLPDGTISFPYIGTVHVAGLTADAIRNKITKGIAPDFSIEPTVIVSVSVVTGLGTGSAASSAATGNVKIYLMGEITKPGMIKVDRGTTLLQAIAEAGGLGKFAADRRLELHRHDAASGKDLVYLFSLTGRPPKGGAVVAPTTELQPGDVIVVPTKRLFE